VIAVGYLRAALADQRKPLTARFRQEVEAALRSSLGFVATFSLDVRPEGATLTVDGEPLPADAGKTLQLDPGEHELVASSPGYDSDRRHITATAGRHGEVVMHLQPSVASARSGGTAVGAGVQLEPVPLPLKVLTIGGFSLALAGGVVGIAAGVKTLSDEDELSSLCPDKQCSEDHADELDDAKSWGTVSTVAFALGGAGAIAGIVGAVLWARHDGRDSASGATSLTLSASASASATLVTMGGRF